MYSICCMQNCQSIVSGLKKVTHFVLGLKISEHASLYSVSETFVYSTVAAGKLDSSVGSDIALKVDSVTTESKTIAFSNLREIFRKDRTWCRGFLWRLGTQPKATEYKRRCLGKATRRRCQSSYELVVDQHTRPQVLTKLRISFLELWGKDCFLWVFWNDWKVLNSTSRIFAGNLNW